MSIPKRSEIHPGMRVQIVEKQNQRTGQLTEGVVSRILTSSPAHPHGIKVMLTDGKVGRVQVILPPVQVILPPVQAILPPVESILPPGGA